MNDKIKIIKSDEFITTNWSGGKTTELFIYPKGSKYKEKNFQFRISSATIELEESKFTKLKGINRYITPLDGELKISHGREKFIKLKPFQIYEFSGELDTTSYGKVRDFNLMLMDKANGKLESLSIGDEILLSKLEDGFEIFYSYNGFFKFLINEEELILKPDELLIVNTWKFDSSIKIKIKSNSESWILRSSIHLEK